MKLEWQPIETAPKDGSDFLAYHSERRLHYVCYAVTAKDGGVAVVLNHDATYLKSVTHWMPLPQPPEEDG